MQCIGLQSTFKKFIVGIVTHFSAIQMCLTRTHAHLVVTLISVGEVSVSIANMRNWKESVTVSYLT